MEAAREEARSELGGKQRQILVVDDDSSYRDVLSSGLKSQGFCVRLATDGRSALRLFAETTFDAVLLDILLPDISGIDVCRELRKTSDIPILMVSALRTRAKIT
jgi:DNA-binding response OmpR family regulator